MFTLNRIKNKIKNILKFNRQVTVGSTLKKEEYLKELEKTIDAFIAAKNKELFNIDATIKYGSGDRNDT